MPYSKDHKLKTRRRIVETARVLFNRHGFNGVTIEMIMEGAALTRGGFYNHFKSKSELYAEAVSSFLTGRGAQWRAEAGVDVTQLSPEMVNQMVSAYLSEEHLNDLGAQCPMIALPSDVARADPSVQKSYQDLLTAMVWLFETGMADADQSDTVRDRALAMASLCVGGMILARTLPNSDLANEVRSAALATAMELSGGALRRDEPRG